MSGGRLDLGREELEVFKDDDATPGRHAFQFLHEYVEIAVVTQTSSSIFRRLRHWPFPVVPVRGQHNSWKVQRLQQPRREVADLAPSEWRHESDIWLQPTHCPLADVFATH